MLCCKAFLRSHSRFRSDSYNAVRDCVKVELSPSFCRVLSIATANGKVTEKMLTTSLDGRIARLLFHKWFKVRKPDTGHTA